MAGVVPVGTELDFAVRPFAEADLGVVVGWVPNAETLRWLAPSTAWPLTVKKVRAWRRDGGRAYGMHAPPGNAPIGYGELNPMEAQPGHFWLGHVIIDPAWQGRGLGRRFTTELARLAFDHHRATRLILVVFPDNLAAIRCYHRVGFKTVREEYHAFGSDPRLHMLRRLEMGPDDLRRA